MDIAEIAARVPAQRQRLDTARREVGEAVSWYPYDILGNLGALDLLLHDEHRDMDRLAQGRPVVDIGAADGDLAFLLEQVCGWTVDIVDHGPTNMNGLQAAHLLRDHLGSAAEIHDIDLDSQFRLPRQHYGLVLLLGILYHLQNPLYILRELSRVADHLLLSTRVARFAGPDRTPIAHLPVGYLVDATELNDDPTNFWIFSPAGLARLVDRAGWHVAEVASFGDLELSDASSMEHDERCFMLLRSTHAPG